MIRVRINAGPLMYSRYYFADRPQTHVAVGVAEFSCCHARGEQPLFKRHAEYTRLIELCPTGGELLETIPKQCRYKIQRAERDGVVCAETVDFDEYLAFHAEFCRSKQRLAPSFGFFAAHREHLLITRAMLGKDTLVMHAHLLDSEASRGRLFTSSSLFRQEKDNAARAMIGRANRYLHYWDMQQMAGRGLRIYDFGGYAPGTTDPELIGLNEFKESFGGAVAEESTYVSLPLELSRRAVSVMRRIRQGRPASLSEPFERLQPEHDPRR